MPRVTFRLLQAQGLTPVEATRLTAFLCGLPTADLDWSLHQINQLVFLRQLYLSDRAGVEGRRPLASTGSRPAG